MTLKTIQVNIYGAPWTSQGGIDAIQFINQAVSQGNSVKRVFFFFDGVYHGLNAQSPASDEFPFLSEWQKIRSLGIELLCCIAASANRGVLSSAEAQRYQKPNATLAEGFELAGLGQWASGQFDCDQIISFK